MSGNPRLAPRSIVVVGGGLTASLAALTLRRALPRSEVTLLQLPPHPASLADRCPLADPEARALLAFCGLLEDRLIGSESAVPVLGTTFSGFGPRRFTVAHGDGPPPDAGTPLHLLALAGGWQDRLEWLNPTAALIERERFVDGARSGGGIAAAVDFALRLSPEAMQPILADALSRAGVTSRACPQVEVEFAGENVAVLRAGGEALRSDLYVDATGPSRSLSPDGWRSWDELLPWRRMLVRQARATPYPADRYARTASSIEACWPAPAGRELRATIGDVNDETVVELAPGQLEHPMRGNVVTIGDAAVDPGPILSFGLPLACRGIWLLLDLLPSSAPEPSLAGEYNRRVALAVDSAREAVSLTLGKGSGPLIGRFGRHGRVAPAEGGLIGDVARIQLLLGIGEMPTQRDPVATSVPADVAEARLSALLASIAALVRDAPPYDRWLAGATRRAG